MDSISFINVIFACFRIKNTNVSFHHYTTSVFYCTFWCLRLFNIRFFHVVIFHYYTLSIHSTLFSSKLLFVSKAIPTIGPVPIVLATPLSVANTACPFVTLPTTLTGTRPTSAIACPSEPLFIKYAGSVDITPAMYCELALAAVVSASPPTVITVPGKYASSVVYFSAKSAYCADVASPLNTLVVNVFVLGLYVSPVLSTSIPCPPLVPSTNVM